MSCTFKRYVLLSVSITVIHFFMGCASPDSFCRQSLSGEWAMDANGFLFNLSLEEEPFGVLKGTLKPLIAKDEITAVRGTHNGCYIHILRNDDDKAVQEFFGHGRQNGSRLVFSGRFTDYRYEAGWAAVKKKSSKLVP